MWQKLLEVFLERIMSSREKEVYERVHELWLEALDRHEKCEEQHADCEKEITNLKLKLQRVLLILKINGMDVSAETDDGILASSGKTS